MRCCQEILYGIIQMAQAFLIIDAMHLATAGIFDAQLTKLVLSLHAYFTGLSDELVSKSSFNAVLCMTAGIQTSSWKKNISAFPCTTPQYFRMIGKEGC